jgi:alcohol dehydrogenase (cytochrome c)
LKAGARPDLRDAHMPSWRNFVVSVNKPAISSSEWQAAAWENTMNRQPFVLAIAVTAGMLAVPLMADAATGSSSKPAVYTTAQAQQGESAYSSHCANCHGADLQGKVGPALKGRQFHQMVTSQDLNGATLLAFISQHMPLTNPGSLDKTQYDDVTAYILKENGYPAGSTKLSASNPNLKKVTFSSSSKG